NVRAVPRFAAGNFVDFIDEKNSHLLDAVHRHAGDLIHVNQAVLFFLNQIIEGLGDRHFSLLLLLPEHAGEHVLYIDVHFFDALIRDDFEGRHGTLAYLYLNHTLIEFAFTKLDSKLFARPLDLLAALGFRSLVRLRGQGPWGGPEIGHGASHG